MGEQTKKGWSGMTGPPSVSPAMLMDRQRMLPLARRAVLFLVGGALSYAINVCVFDLKTGGLHWPRAVAEWPARRSR